METFGSNPLWDLSQPLQYSQIADEDFLALLTKPFPTNGDAFSFPTAAEPDAVNPQALSHPTFTSDATPPLTDDNSPSPPSYRSEPRSRRESMAGDGDTTPGESSQLKRKASGQGFGGEPQQKSQHSDPNHKKTLSSLAANRRKPGAGDKDEVRLMRRKEQNRAAQRAFRERKEKHVKDLEDRVAELEESERAKDSENENLRDLLSRLQSENQSLKQSRFTFSVPQNQGAMGAAGPGPSTQSNMAAAAASPMNLFSSTPLGPPSQSAPATTSASGPNDDIDWNSLTAFDPSVLSMLDEPTDAMNLDKDTNGKSPYRTLVSNPMFMSFADSTPMAYDQWLAPSRSNTSSGSQEQQQQTVTGSGWTPSSQGWSSPDPSGQSLDDIFNGNFLTMSESPGSFMPSPGNSMSPVSHRANSLSGNGTGDPHHSGSGSSSNSPPESQQQLEAAQQHHKEGGDSCPRTREAFAKHVTAGGPSMFAEAPPPTSPPTISRQHDAQGKNGEQIFCAGSNFPKVQQSPENIEVLAAWRQITNDTRFKDLDINELCAEFTNKAKCDGTKVVLEPSGVSHIIEKLASKSVKQI